ncbi:MAG: hypothetical protein ACRD4Q_00180 [Candidatus Acidiferrales bacterium]
MATTAAKPNGIPGEQRNPLGSLLNVLRGAQKAPASLINAPSAELRGFLQGVFQACLEEGERGSAARRAVQKVVQGFQELAHLTAKDTVQP